MNVLCHLTKGKKKVDESFSSSRSRSDMTSSLFQVIVSFNSIYSFSLLFTIFYSYVLFAGHYIEGAPKRRANGGFDSSRAGPPC
jgi:hypothetical protein